MLKSWRLQPSIGFWGIHGYPIFVPLSLGLVETLTYRKLYLTTNPNDYVRNYSLDSCPLPPFFWGEGRILYNFLGISGVFHVLAGRVSRSGRECATSRATWTRWSSCWTGCKWVRPTMGYTSDDFYAANIFWIIMNHPIWEFSVTTNGTPPCFFWSWE